MAASAQRQYFISSSAADSFSGKTGSLHCANAHFSLQNAKPTEELT